MQKHAGWWLALALVALSATAAARSFHGVELPDRITVAGQPLVLNGMGVREQTMLRLDVYVAGLYLPVKTDDGAAVLAGDTVRQMVLVFRRSVGQGRARKALRDGLNQSAGADRYKTEVAADAFEKWLPPFRKGDRLVLTYMPNTGLEITGPDRLPMRVEGKEFADVMFGIWVGPRCVDGALRAGLLGAL